MIIFMKKIYNYYKLQELSSGFYFNFFAQLMSGFLKINNLKKYQYDYINKKIIIIINYSNLLLVLFLFFQPIC